MAKTMHERHTPKEGKGQLDQFMEEVEKKNEEVPTMEDLAGTSLLKQINNEERRSME